MQPCFSAKLLWRFWLYSACGGQILNGYTAAGSGLKGRLPEHRCKAAGNQEEEVNLDLSHRLQNKTGNLHANNQSTENKQTVDWNTDATKTYQINTEIKFYFGFVCWCISFFSFFLPHCFLVKKRLPLLTSAQSCRFILGPGPVSSVERCGCQAYAPALCSLTQPPLLLTCSL